MQSLKRLITAGSIALLPLAASAATIVVPIAGSGPGANGTTWSSELTLHNTSSAAVTLDLTYHDRVGVYHTAPVTLAARSTKTFSDIVGSTFVRASSTGGIEITVPDAAADKVAVTARVLNNAPTGEFGQNVTAVRAADFAGPGDLSILNGPSNVAKYRFNFGVYALENVAVHWELVNADGTVAASKDVNYAAGSQTQYNNGVATLFGATPKNDDSIHVLVSEGKATFYGSAVNNDSGDPQYVEPVRVKEDIRINFAGVDLNEDGTVDVADANHDGVLDHPIDMYTSLFPNFFKLVTNAPGATVTYTIIDPPSDLVLLDDGVIEWYPTGDLKGKTGTLKVRVTSGYENAIITIPVNFR